LLETNGSQDISQVDGRCVKIVDIKCPSSGETDENDFENLNRLSDKDEIKFVIGDKEDYEYAKKMLDLLGSDPLTVKAVHFSPVFGKLDPKTLAEWILEDNLDVRLHLQLHKYIEVK
jgi:7-carboxy-7-deazaguanine synthase